MVLNKRVQGTRHKVSGPLTRNVRTKNMKNIILLIIVAFTAAAYADEIGLTTNITDIPAQDGRDIGKIVKKDILRGPDRIYTLLKFDRDRDGEFDHIQEMLCYRGKNILSITHSGDHGIVFTGHTGIDAYYADTNNDGTRDAIMFVSDDMVVREKYQIDENNEYFHPVDAASLKEIQEGSALVAPFTSGVLETIDPEE